MLQQIEQLKHGTTLIFPRTSQEAALVNYKNKQISLFENNSKNQDDIWKTIVVRYE